MTASPHGSKADVFAYKWAFESGRVFDDAILEIRALESTIAALRGENEGLRKHAALLQSEITERIKDERPF